MHFHFHSSIWHWAPACGGYDTNPMARSRASAVCVCVCVCVLSSTVTSANPLPCRAAACPLLYRYSAAASGVALSGVALERCGSMVATNLEAGAMGICMSMLYLVRVRARARVRAKARARARDRVTGRVRIAVTFRVRVGVRVRVRVGVAAAWCTYSGGARPLWPRSMLAAWRGSTHGLHRRHRSPPPPAAAHSKLILSGLSQST